MKCKRKLLNIIVNGEERRIITIYLHLLEENIDWFINNQEDILKELCLVIQDNLDVLQQQVYDLESNENIISFYRLRGETISLAYKLQRKTEYKGSILVYSDDLNSTKFNTIPTASFVLNPIYLFPYGTYPLIPAPYPVSSSSSSSTSSSFSSSLLPSSSSMSITNYFRVIK